MKKKIIQRLVPSNEQHQLLSVPPLLRRIYAARDVQTEDQLQLVLQRLHSADQLLGIHEAVELLANAFVSQQRMLVVADFDADGATSCAVAVRALRSLGANDVHYVVPDRFRFGYGLTPEIVDVAADWHPDLIITVDNGISSCDGVAHARALGIRVLVTDHHLPARQIPNANAIVNPNQNGDPFPSKHLAGVGVIFYVMTALRKHLREQGWFQKANRKEPNLAALLDLVALGTVADVVKLDTNNRILVEQGLRRIRANQCCCGIRALLQVAGRTLEQTVTSDLGFAVGPRLNAAGRLEDMSLGIACLLAETDESAMQIALRLDQLNQERRKIELEMRQQALQVIDQDYITADAAQPRFGVCLFDESWHQGVIGILASRIKDKVHRPVIAFAKVSEDELKGSARSIPGVHIRDVLDAIAARHPELICKFGGHAMAAGLSLDRRHYTRFCMEFDREVATHVSEELLHRTVLTDGELTETEYSIETAELLRWAGPWGQGFPEPIFEGKFEVIQQRMVGGKHLKMSLRPVSSRTHIEAIAFNWLEDSQMPKLSNIRAAFRLDINDYQGLRIPQLIIEYLEDIPSSATLNRASA